jgi:hypothetical protein
VAVELGAAGILAAWLGISALSQVSSGAFERWVARIKARDVAGLIPQWAFFAPNPGITDHHLLYRDRGPESRVTPWRAVPRQKRRGPRALWNPGKRAEKALVDATSVLVGMAPRAGDATNLALSAPYLVLLEHVSAQPRARRATARQFMVIEIVGAGLLPAKAVLVSSWHRLSERR